MHLRCTNPGELYSGVANFNKIIYVMFCLRIQKNVNWFANVIYEGHVLLYLSIGYTKGQNITCSVVNPIV